MPESNHIEFKSKLIEGLDIIYTSTFMKGRSFQNNDELKTKY